MIAEGNAKKFEKALEWSKKSVEMTSNRSQYLYNSTYALLLAKAGKKEEAIIEARNAISKGEKFDLHFIHHGVLNECSEAILRSTEDSLTLIQALKWSRKSVEMRSVNYEYWDTYVKLLEKVGDLKELNKAVARKREIGLQLGIEEKEVL